jgi:hypothetical protein
MVFPDGRSYSSREPKGTAWEQIDYAKDPKDWLFVDLVDIDRKAVDAARMWADAHENIGYDFIGILRFYLTRKSKNSKFFCSEVCVTLAQLCGRFRGLDPSLVSPQRLYDLALADYQARRGGM